MGDPVTCPVCKTKFKTYEAYKAHNQLKHLNMKREPDKASV